MSDHPKNHRMEDLLLYEQNLLEEDERKELEEHLRGCAECQATQVTVRKFLPMLHEALRPNELPAEELLRRVKAQMREKGRALSDSGTEAGTSFAAVFTRMRLAILGFALAGAAAIAIAIQALLPSREPALVAKGEDAGAPGKRVAAPRPLGWVSDSVTDGGSEGDGGGDAGDAQEKKLGDPPP